VNHGNMHNTSMEDMRLASSMDSIGFAWTLESGNGEWDLQARADSEQEPRSKAEDWLPLIILRTFPTCKWSHDH
jgi:hypothetical protein